MTDTRGDTPRHSESFRYTLAPKGRKLRSYRKGIMKHTLDQCEYASTEYQDVCPDCGELTACVCLASIVSEWQIEGTGSTGSFAFRYQYKEKASDLVERFGYASTYREAMDSIAHSVNCEKENA